MLEVANELKQFMFVYITQLEGAILMKKLLMLLMVCLMFITACSDNKENQHQQTSEKEKATPQKDKKTHEQTNAKTKEADSKTSNEKHTQATEDVSQLSDQMKAALVFSSDKSAKYTLTKKEILTGVFEQDYMNKPEKKQLYKLYLINTKGYSELPKDMKIYSVYPPKTGFKTLIGIGKDKAFIGGTQSPGTYKQLLETGKELDLKTLYKQNKQFKSLNELAKKVEFTKDDPMLNEETRKEFEGKESPTTMAHARSQVYEMINKFEGQPLNTKDYIWDNVKWNNGMNDWTVNYRDKNLEIVGTYKKEAGQPITKLDAQGNKIK